MALSDTIVLDLSALPTESLAGSAAAIAHVQMCRVRGKQAIVVVGPTAERAERDIARAGRLGATAQPEERAAVEASGSIEAAERFASILREAGIDAAAPEVTSIGPATRGHALDAEPRSINARALSSAFEESEIVVVPGGVGHNREGVVTVLGRDAGTLSAAFLADRLAIPVIKPDSSTVPNRDSVTGRKIARLLEATGVTIGGTEELESTGTGVARAVRVAVLGSGDPAELLRYWVDSLPGNGFERVSFDSVPDTEAIKGKQPDVIVDLENRAEASYEIASWGLRTGRSIITANTKLVAERGGGLLIASLIGGGDLRASGSLTGVPDLASTVSRVASWPGVQRIQATFSPLADRVLDLRSEGFGEDEAETRAAAELGLTGRDIVRARDGSDAVTRIGAAAQLAYGSVPSTRTQPRGPAHVSDADLARASAQGRRYRVIATAERVGDRVSIRVGPVPLRADDPLVELASGSVRSTVESRTGEISRVSGRLHQPGSVAAAVLRDLIEIGRVPSPAYDAATRRWSISGLDPVLGVTA